MLLEGKVAVITGGASGLGEGIAEGMARAGAQVVVSDLRRKSAEQVADRLRKETGRQSLALAADVRRKDHCAQLVAQSLDKMGAIDILVCAAGVGGFSHRPDTDAPLILENISLEDWTLAMDVNLKGVFLCNQAIAAYLRQQKSGRIINISSIAGRKGADWLPHYSASKAGVIVLTQSVALQLAPFGVTVNTLCPGIIRTAMWDVGAKVLGQAHPAFKGMSPDEVFQAMVRQMIPLGRPQTADDIGHMAVFLASDKASEITGQAINVDGGACFN
jgi:NAD(P)-dependent dehydrogenase (short-subunit alcohol dehydrogenase family)